MCACTMQAACQRYESFLEQRGHKLDKQAHAVLYTFLSHPRMCIYCCEFAETCLPTAKALQVPHPVFIPSRGRPEKARVAGAS